MSEVLLEDLACRTDGIVPRLITTDEYPAYDSAIQVTYGGGRREPYCYATVTKRREKGRVVEVRRSLIIGSRRRLRETLEQSEHSRTVNTSAVERFHGTNRQFNARKRRRSYLFSKDIEYHLGVSWLCIVAYNFCRFHGGLRQKLQDHPPRYHCRTPAMAAGLTDRKSVV